MKEPQQQNEIESTYVEPKSPKSAKKEAFIDRNIKDRLHKDDDDDAKRRWNVGLEIRHNKSPSPRPQK